MRELQLQFFLVSLVRKFFYHPCALTFRTYIAVPSSAWIDDYFEWSVEGRYCCRLHENGSFCQTEEEPALEECLNCNEGVEPETIDYVGGADFDEYDEYNYDYTYGDLELDYDAVDKRRKKKQKPVYKPDIYDYSYSYGDMSIDYDSGKPATGTREIAGDDGWPNNSKDPSETHKIHKKHRKATQVKRSTPRSTSGTCHSCPISAVYNNPFRPDPEVFNQYLPMFLQDNPDIHCPKAGHAAYGQVC